MKPIHLIGPLGNLDQSEVADERNAGGHDYVLSAPSELGYGGRLAKTGIQGTWSIPQPSASRTLVLNWNITPYNRPGTFTKRAAFAGSVELDAPQGQFTPVAASVLSITVNPDGSGTATFSELKDGYTGATVWGAIIRS